MAITINGHTISTVVISSIMGHSGGGMFPLTLLLLYRRLRQVIEETGIYNLTKSSTIAKNIGNFQLYNPFTWKYIQRIGCDGLLNAYGLTNDGVKANAKEIADSIKIGYRVIPNFYPQFSKGRSAAIADALCAISVYRWFMGEAFWAMELNYSCPNSKEKIRENIDDALACTSAIKRDYPSLCQIAKISIVHPYEFAQELVSAGVDIIHAINTIPYGILFPNGPASPLARVGGGGVSGGPSKSKSFLYNCLLRKYVNVPLIMGNGVCCLDDARRFREIGADAISICTIARLNPLEAENIIYKCQ